MPRLPFEVGRTEVISISPQEFRIALDEIQEKDLSVLPSITGQPAGGGRVVDARAEPAVVRALGPSSIVVRTSPYGSTADSH